ncbi:hypothetical protein DY000_02042583 [Brassica cretica]|uniref:Uncharacterized protein n=1 Tax=Brassica cretica TaxID=69181 RepID=A0ABQ7BCV8_BRACR|nr:hypothetical protein DY000_02042583 [Brassica cretica]
MRSGDNMGINELILRAAKGWSENMLYESWENNHAISFVLMKVWYSPAIELLDRSLVFPDTVEIDSISEGSYGGQGFTRQYFIGVIDGGFQIMRSGDNMGINELILRAAKGWSENMLYESWENNHAISFVLMKVWYSPAIELLDRSLVFPDTVEIDSISEVEHSRFLRLKVHAFTLLPLID